MPDDVLLSILRRCERNDWLSLACACGALRPAALCDELWLSEPELRHPAVARAGVLQPAMPAAAGPTGEARALSATAAES